MTQVENLDGDGTIELIGDVTFLGLGFGYQQAFNDWFAAYLTIGGGGRIGTSAEAILSSGLNAFVNLSLGGKFRLWRNQNFLLSARLDYASTGVSGISILDWGREIVDSGEFSDSLLVSKSSTGSARGGLNLSYAPRPWIGFTVLTLFGLGDNADDLETEFAFQGQIWTDIDLNLLTPVPIGFVLGYDRNSFVQQGGEIAKSIDAFIFGFFYTGRDDFSIGLEFQSANLPLRDVDASISTGEGTINLRYLF